MNDETKKQINERYEKELDKGERFWPDTIFKDVVMSLGIFILLILLATFVGIPVEAKADGSGLTGGPRWSSWRMPPATRTSRCRRRRS